MANELDQITGGLEENIALSNIRKQKAEEQANQHEQLRSEFDDYARGGTGEPLDMNRVEAYKNQVPSHMFQASLYKLQEETYPVGESFSTPILDKYVGDDPNAYKDYEAYDNRQASMNRAYRIKDYHYGMFTYDSRADYPNMNDEAYEIMSVGGYFSEMYNKPMDEVVKNMDTYVGMYGNQKNIKDPNIKSVFDQIKGEVFDMGESMKRDDQYWSEGLDMALRGESIEKTVTGKLGTPEGDRQAQVYRMAADYIYGEYGNNIIKAKEYLTLLGEGDKRPETLDARKPSGAEVQGRLAMANQLMGESPEDRQEILSLIFKLAELEGEEVEGAVNRVAKSMQRAISGSIEDITSGSTKALLDPNVFIPKALEIKDDKIAEPLRQRTELMQDLRMARNIYKDIEAQGTGEMIAQTTAANIHYAGMFALGWSGFGAMALDMASKRDEQLRIEYPDMSPDTRWSISQADAVVDASLERFKYKMVFSGFPTLTKFVGGTGVKRAAGVFGVRVASAQATNYAEEVAQNMTNPIFHKMWVAAGADIPDVTQEDWDRNFWMMEDGDKVPFIDGELFVSLLGMSMLGAGGRGAYDKFGGANVKRILDEKDKLLLQGFPEAQADAIIKANQTDTTKAFEMFQDGLEDMSQQERRANMNQAKADGADRRVLKAELDEYKQRVEEDGTEDDKVNLRVREAQFDFAMKYDAHLEEREDGRWDFVSPNTDVAPNQTFETKEQADEAMLQHYQKVDQMFLGAMAEQAQRIDAMPKNKEAMKLAVKDLKEAQAKAGVEADIALDQDLTTLAEFGAQSKKNMEIALERVQHELLRKNILRPATVKDLEAWTINAQVTLAKNGRGYVQKVAKGGNIADVYEDASEGFLKTMIHKDVVSKDWVKDQLFKYQKDSGDSVKWGFKSVEDITDGRMVEAFSDLAKANLWNASKDNKMGKLSSLIRALKQFFKSILDAAESLLKLQAEGKIDTDFQTLLDQSVGLNMDEQIARQTEEVRQEILGETTMSIAPSAEGKPYKDRSGDEAGTPLTETEIREGIEDESGTLADVEVNGDKLADIGFKQGGVSFSITPKYRTLKPEDVKGKKLFGFYADRMRVGTYTGLDPESGIKIACQGGIGYPLAHEGAAWAVSSDPMHTAIANAADARDGIAVVFAYQTGNITGNETFAMAYTEELKWAVKSGKISEDKALEILNKVREESIALYKTLQKREQKKADAKAERDGKEPTQKPLAPWAIKNKDAWKSLDGFFDSLLKENGGTFDSRGDKMFRTGLDVKGLVTAQKLGANNYVKEGMPDITKMVKLLEVDNSADINTGDVLGLVEIDKGQAGNAVSAEDIGVQPHRSYPKVIKGRAYGQLPKRVNVLDFFDPRKGALPLAGEVLKMKDEARVAELEDVSFSIAQDATYLDLAKNPDKNRAELQAMVDARAKAAGYDSPKVYHGTNANAYSDQDFTVFATNQERGASFFSSSEDLASSYGEQVYSIRLKLENPFIVDAKGGGWSSLGDADIISELSPEYLKFKDDQLKDNAELLKRIGKLLGTDMDSTVSVDEAQTKKVGDLSGSRNDIDWVGKFARKYGYDGAIVKNVKDAPLATGYDNPIQDTYLAFNPNQIKSADPVTYDSDGNVIPLSQRFDAGRDEVSMSIAPAEDAVMARITSLMRDPDAKLEVYKNMASRLNKVRERVYAKHIAYGGVTAASMREADKEMDDREFIVASVAQIQAIASVLPADVRVKMGSIEGLVKRSTTRGVTNEMLKKIDKLDNALDKHLSDHYLAKLNKSVKQGKVKKRAGEKVARGTITAIKHDEHDLIVGVMKMTDEQIEKAIAENEAVLINPQTDEANATDAVVNIIRLQTFGKLTKEGKRPQANATTMKEASDQLAKLIADGKSAYAVLQEEKKERRAGMKSEMVDVVSGGKGVPDSDVKSRAKTKRSKQGLRNIVLEQKVKMNSWEHLIEHLSRLDPSPSMQSRIRVWTEKVHRATHAESQAVAEKQVMFEKTVAEIYGVDTNKRNWYVNTLPHFEKLAKPKERDISKAYDNTKQVVSVQPDHAQELLMGVSDVILIDEGLVKVTEADLKAIQEQVDKHPNAKTYKFTRQEHKGVKKVYLSIDQILNLTMLYGQEGYKDVMHFHGYSEEVMKQLEKELSPKDKQLRSFMLAYNDKNYDYFNNVYSKVFGVNMRKIKNYSKGSFEHQGQQPVELMDAQGATAMSVAPSAGMSRIQHLAEPKQDAGAIPLFLEGIRETEHFVAWGELIGDMRATFLNKEVQDTITVYHGDELRQRINSDIEEFTQGGVTVTSNNRNKLLDKLRTDFTVMSLAYKWGIVIKQWTSLPAYASHIPMTDYLKYQAEIMKSLDNFKKIKDLPYTQHRFNKGYDRDVMIILNHSQKKSKLERVAEFGMKGVSIGDITPVIIGGYAAYRHGYEQAKKANPDAGEAFWEDRGILAFEMLTDNAQQSGQMKDLSGWAKGSSLARVMTMYSSSLIQYTNNETTAILDVISGKVDSKKKLAKIAFINHVLLPSSFYWVSWFTANLFKEDEDKESAEEAINGWIASMMLGPFSGVFVFGRGLASIASGYRYDLPVLSGIESGARAAHKMWNMAFDDEPLTPDDFLEALDYTADAYAFTVGKGLGKAYEISKNIAKSFGFDRYDARRMAMTDVDRAVYDLSKLKKAIYAEEMPEETDKRAYKKAQHDRWNLLADEYDYIREVNESDWDAIKKKLQSKGLLPKEVEKRMRR